MPDDGHNPSEADTDVLLAMLQSIIGEDLPQDALLEALMNADGDVQRAANALRGEGSSSSHVSNIVRPSNTSARKRGATALDDWLTPSAAVDKHIQKKPRSKAHKLAESTTHQDGGAAIIVADEEDEGRPIPRPEPTRTPKKPKINLMDILKQPPASPRSTAASKLAPMTLGTPALIAKHTPTTLHTTVLPPELACRLFYAMLDEAEAHWKRSRWYIGAPVTRYLLSGSLTAKILTQVDKLVESPHLTSFYVRDKASSEWEESAKYWWVVRHY